MLNHDLNVMVFEISFKQDLLCWAVDGPSGITVVITLFFLVSDEKKGEQDPAKWFCKFSIGNDVDLGSTLPERHKKSFGSKV